MNTLELEEPTRDLLQSIRAGRLELGLDDVDADLAEMAVWEIGRPVLNDAGLGLARYNQFRWFLRELAAVLRHKDGWDLAFGLEHLLRKWVVRYRVESPMAQLLVRTVCDHLSVRPGTGRGDATSC